MACQQRAPLEQVGSPNDCKARGFNRELGFKAEKFFKKIANQLDEDGGDSTNQTEGTGTEMTVALHKRELSNVIHDG